jgi:hypothetical protein
MDEEALTTEEAQNAYYKMSLNGINFDIPSSYFFRDFKVSGGKRWSRPKGEKRHEVDVISITGLLPDMAPYTVTNAEEFEKPGFGNKVHASIGYSPNDWTYYFKNVVPRLKPLPTSDETPSGFTRWLDASADKQMENEIWMNANHPTPSLVRISCDVEGSVPFPRCEVIREYRQKFEMKYSFAREHLAKWAQIDQAVENVFNRFIENAKNSK